MSSALRFVWDNVIGLFFEDGQLAIGIVLALVVTWVLATLSSEIHPLAGWLLLAFLIVLLMLNLARTAHRAKRRVA